MSRIPIPIDPDEFHSRVAATLADVVMDLKAHPERAAVLPDTADKLLQTLCHVVLTAMAEEFIKKCSTEPHEAPAISAEVSAMMERYTKH